MDWTAENQALLDALRHKPQSRAQQACSVLTPIASEVLPASAASRRPATVTDLIGCQFPLWGHRERPGRNPRFCGAPREPGESWCLTCCAKVVDLGMGRPGNAA